MKKKILVVDNNKVFLRLLGGFLEGKGYEVKTAEDGLAALAVLDTFVPEVIFVDLVMPLIDGERLCRIVRRMPAFDAVVLVVISAVAAEARIDFASFGADACVAKGPFKGMQAHLNTILDHVDADAKGRLRKTIYGVHDVDERQVTKELIAVRRHFEITVGNMVDGFVELTQGGSVVYANRVVATLLGTSEEELLSASLADFFPAEYRQALREQILAIGDEPLGIGCDEPLLVNGRYLLLKFVPVDDSGRCSILGLVYDVSAQKRADEAWRRQVADLEKTVAEKNAALDNALAEIESMRVQLGQGGVASG